MPESNAKRYWRDKAQRLQQERNKLRGLVEELSAEVEELKRKLDDYMSCGLAFE